MNDSVAIVDEVSQDIVNITIPQRELSAENFVKDLENELLTSQNILTEIKHFCNEIHNMEILESLKKKGSQFEQACKEKEKYSNDLLYIDGDIQYKKLINERDTKKVNELKNVIQEAIIELKKREDEKESVFKKYIDKHHAHKQTAKYYKTLLNFYTHVEKIEDNFHITVCYFTLKYDDTYSFTISKNEKENQWILNNVKPHLEKSQYEALQSRLCNTNNLSALVYTLRKIFLLKKV